MSESVPTNAKTHWTFLLVNNTTPAPCSPGVEWMPSCTAEWGGDYTTVVFACGPRLWPQPALLVHKEALCFHTPRTYAHTSIEWGFDTGCKRLYWYTGQACLWHQCCQCYCSPRQGQERGAHTACAYMLLYEWALCQQQRREYYQPRLKVVSFVFPQSTADVTVPPVLTPPRDPGCRTDLAQPALHPPGITAAAGSPPDAPLSSSTSSSPTALPSLTRSDPGTGGGGLQSRSNSSERLLEASSGSSDDYHDADGTRRARAVENQYSFYWATRQSSAQEENGPCVNENSPNIWIKFCFVCCFFMGISIFFWFELTLSRVLKLTSAPWLQFKLSRQ